MENEPTTKRTFFSWLIMSAAGVIGRRWPFRSPDTSCHPRSSGECKDG